MDYQEIFEKVRYVIADVISIKCEDINLDFPLFDSELYDKRIYWSSSGSCPRVSNFIVEDSQYYSYRLVTAINQDTLDADEICLQLMLEFDNVEFTDEICMKFNNVEKIVNYIAKNINSCS
jgi:acyl carrier protein